MLEARAGSSGPLNEMVMAVATFSWFVTSHTLERSTEWLEHVHDDGARPGPAILKGDAHEGERATRGINVRNCKRPVAIRHHRKDSRAFSIVGRSRPRAGAGIAERAVRHIELFRSS
jgi:hypothetical protein